MEKRVRGCDSAQIIQVIETKTAQGSGTTPDDPVRIVTEYWSFDGHLLAQIDPVMDSAETREDVRS